jgi:adenylate cyclase, class 2
VNPPPQEIEVKFALPHLADLRARLLRLGARQLSPRTLEVNLRFDDPTGKLAEAGQVLRLRRDRAAHLTYKAPGPVPEERLEIDLEIDSLEAGQRLLEALGYRLVAAYEKYREVFRLEEGLVMLDDLPFGHFVEIEAGSIDRLKHLGAALDLAWERRITVSYLDLFHGLQGYPWAGAQAATFEHWDGLAIPSHDLLEDLARTLQSQRSVP